MSTRRRKPKLLRGTPKYDFGGRHPLLAYESQGSGPERPPEHKELGHAGDGDSCRNLVVYMVGWAPMPVVGSIRLCEGHLQGWIEWR